MPELLLGDLMAFLFPGCLGTAWALLTESTACRVFGWGERGIRVFPLSGTSSGTGTSSSLQAYTQGTGSSGEQPPVLLPSQCAWIVQPLSRSIA